MELDGVGRLVVVCCEVGFCVVGELWELDCVTPGADVVAVPGLVLVPVGRCVVVLSAQDLSLTAHAWLQASN